MPQALHPYATDSPERKSVPLILAVAAILTALLISKAFAYLRWTVPWWFDAPSVMSLYGLFHAAFDRYVWKWSVCRQIGLIVVPNLSGDWAFRIRSNYRQTDVDARATITQTWRGIHIRLETGQSRSASRIAALLTADPNEFVLTYEFLNTPRQSAVATMHMHHGSAEIRFPRGDTVALGDGEYYSGRDRENRGELHVTRL